MRGTSDLSMDEFFQPRADSVLEMPVVASRQTFAPRYSSEVDTSGCYGTHHRKIYYHHSARYYISLFASPRNEFSPTKMKNPNPTTQTDESAHLAHLGPHKTYVRKMQKKNMGADSSCPACATKKTRYKYAPICASSNEKKKKNAHNVRKYFVLRGIE